MKWGSDISIDGINQPVAFAKFMRAAEDWHAGRVEQLERESPVRIWLEQDYSVSDLPCKECCIGVTQDRASAPQRAAAEIAAEDTHASDVLYWQSQFRGPFFS